MYKKVIYNGVSSEDYDLVIQTTPVYATPSRDVEQTHIPGRNGDYVIDNNCYANVSRVYSLAKKIGYSSNYTEESKRITEWLNQGKANYCRLEDDYDPKVYRLAKFTGEITTTNIFNRLMTLNVSFDCKPQRFLKIGEDKITSNGNQLTIYNPTIYESQPIITISNINIVYDKVLMLSVLNDSGDATSIITFTNNTQLDSLENITIDSEKLNCTSDNKNANEFVNLNGKPFPKFQSNKTQINLEQYVLSKDQIDSYRNVLNNSKNSVTSLYRPYETLEDNNQIKTVVQPYNSIIDNKKELYEAMNYQAYVASQSQVYNLESFNTILNNSCRVFVQNGALDPTDISNYDFISTDSYTSNDGMIHLLAGVDGYYLAPNDKFIKHYSHGDALAVFKTGTSATIYYYEQETKYYIHSIKAKYTDIPNWLNVDYIYDDDNRSRLTKIVVSTNASGYYWKDKSWLFGKAGWSHITSKTELVTLTWNSYKKAFMNNSGISTKANATYTYKYIEGIVQYDTDLYIVDDNTQDLSSLEIYSSRAGYYRITSNGNVIQKWTYMDSSNILIGRVNGNQDYQVEYLDEVPDYSEESDWPEDISPIPYINNDEHNTVNVLNSNTIMFKVLTNKKYRCTYIDSTTNEIKYGEWVDLQAGDYIKLKRKTSSPTVLQQNVKETVTLCSILSIPEEYQYDRCYKVNDVVSDEHPEWISVRYKTQVTVATDSNNETLNIEVLESDDDLPQTAEVNDRLVVMNIDNNQNGFTLKKYNGSIWVTEKELKDYNTTNINVEVYATHKGYYRWLNNNGWVKYIDDNDRNDLNEPVLLFSSSYNDSNLIIDYVHVLPQYPNTYEKYDIIIEENSAGNPSTVKIYSKVDGYYRCNSDANWSYYKQGDLMIDSVIDTTNIIYELTKDNVDLSNVIISVIPNWWEL